MTDAYTGPGEFLTVTLDSNGVNDWGKVKRHVDRYMEAVTKANEFNGMGGRWLDCACGSGYGSQIVAFAQPSFYLGADRSPQAIDHARTHFSSTWARFARVEIDYAEDDWVAVAGPFDVILSIETLEHLMPDVQESWVEAAADGLTSDGVFIVACPIGNDGPSEYNRYHLHEPSLDGLNALLSSHFKSVEIETEPYVDTGGCDAVQAFAVCR